MFYTPNTHTLLDVSRCIFIKQDFSLNLKLIDWASLVGQLALRICLSPLPSKFLGYRHMLPLLAFLWMLAVWIHILMPVLFIYLPTSTTLEVLDDDWLAQKWWPRLQCSPWLSASLVFHQELWLICAWQLPSYCLVQGLAGSTLRGFFSFSYPIATFFIRLEWKTYINPCHMGPDFNNRKGIIEDAFLLLKYLVFIHCRNKSWNIIFKNYLWENALWGIANESEETLTIVQCCRQRSTEDILGSR